MIKKIKLKILNTVAHTRQFYKISYFESAITPKGYKIFKISTFNSMAAQSYAGLLKYTISFHI